MIGIQREENSIVSLQISDIEDIVKHSNYIMTEKVKKDIIDKKQNKKLSNFIDFQCAVALTNTNSFSLA